MTALLFDAGTLDVLGNRTANLLREATSGALVLLLGLAVLLIGWALARLISAALLAVLRKLRFNDAMRGVLGPGLRAAGGKPARIVSALVFWSVLALAALLGADALGLDLGPSVADRLRDVLPRVVSAGIEPVGGIAIAMGLGGLTTRLFESAGARHGALRGQVVASVLGGFAVLVALEQLGLAAEFIVALSLTAVAAVGIALALAFGLGCRDLARDFVVEVPALAQLRRGAVARRTATVTAARDPGHGPPRAPAARHGVGLASLAHGIASASAGTLFFHVHHPRLRHAAAATPPPDDFSAWVEGVLQDATAAERLAFAVQAHGRDPDLLREALVDVLRSDANGRPAIAPAASAFVFHNVDVVALDLDRRVEDADALVAALCEGDEGAYFHVVEAPWFGDADASAAAWARERGDAQLAAWLDECLLDGQTLAQSRRRLGRRWGQQRRRTPGRARPRAARGRARRHGAAHDARARAPDA